MHFPNSRSHYLDLLDDLLGSQHGLNLLVEVALDVLIVRILKP